MRVVKKYQGIFHSLFDNQKDYQKYLDYCKKQDRRQFEAREMAAKQAQHRLKLLDMEEGDPDYEEVWQWA